MKEQCFQFCSFILKLQLHDAIYRLRFCPNSFIHILSLSNLHNNVASIQKNRGDKSHRVIVALLVQRVLNFLKAQLHGAIYRPDSFVLMLRYCANLKVIKCESTSLNRIVADKSHCVIVA